MKIAIVDDDPSVRQGLRLLLEAQGHATVLYADGTSFLARPETDRVDCALVDLWFTSGMTGIELLRTLLINGDTTPVIMMSVAGDLQSAFNAGELGAVSFLPKPISGIDLQKMLEQVANRQCRIADSGPSRQDLARMQTLTPAERNVLRLLATDKANKEIARALSLSVRTVESHRANIIRKLGTRSKIAFRQFWLAAGSGNSEVTD